MTEKRLSDACWKMWSQIYWIWGIIIVLLTQLIWLSGETLAVIIITACELVLFVVCLVYMRAFWRRFRFTYDDEELRVYSGVFWRKQAIIPFTRVTNIGIMQGPWQRWIKVANIKIETAGQSGTATPETALLSQENYEALRDELLSKVPYTQIGGSDGTGETQAELQAVHSDHPPWQEMTEILRRIEENTRKS